MQGSANVLAFADAVRHGNVLTGTEMGVNGDRRAFALHLNFVAEAMRAIEAEDNGDASPPHASEAIARCMAAMEGNKFRLMMQTVKQIANGRSDGRKYIEAPKARRMCQRVLMM